MPEITRRSLLSFPAVLGFGQLVANAHAAARAQGTEDTLPQPATFTSVDGVLDVDLAVGEATVDMRAGRAVTTYAYNGIVPGETWNVLPGDTLQISLSNNLPPNPDTAMHHDLTRPRMWRNTNLHTHGLHVSPRDNSDNVFLDIEPGETFDYQIAIPDDHTPGHFWYHGHRHGAVAHQLRAGMAGSLIVRGAIDEVDEVRLAREQMMVFQAIELSKSNELLDPIPFPDAHEAFFPRDQILYTVNGVMNPVVKMYPGEVQRWRMLNAAEGKFMSFNLDQHELNVIAWDGLTVKVPDVQTDLLMAAANRADVLVKAGKPGTYRLVLTPGSSQHPGIPGMPHDEPDPADQESAELKPRSVLTLVVEGDGPEMDLPTTLPAYDPPIREIYRTRTVLYTVERDLSDGFLNFGVNGAPFDPERPPYQMKLNTAEEWTIINAMDSKLPHHAHGLHIHINPFLVTKINGQSLETPQWRDTFALSGQTGDSFTFQMNLDDFTGKFVEHCHVVSHEDLGLMEALEVVE